LQSVSALGARANEHDHSVFNTVIDSSEPFEIASEGF
jgi:hypothetical protein